MPSRGKRRLTLQTLLFLRPRYDEPRAREWARSHHYKADKVDETPEHLRLRQRDPADFEPGSFRTIRFGRSGVEGVFGHLKGGAAADPPPARGSSGEKRREARSSPASYSTLDELFG